MLRVLLLSLVLVCATSCAVSSTLTIPSCVDRLEVGGQHQRVRSNGSDRLIFDHTLDVAGTYTEVTLKRGDARQTMILWNSQPDGGHLLIGAVAALFGGVLWASAAYDVTVQDANPLEEGPFYAAVFGTGALGLGALVALTGWHPAAPADIDEFCAEPAASNQQ